MLNSIIFIRSFAHVRNFCCNTFTPYESMYKLHNNTMYNIKFSNNEVITLDPQNEKSDEINMFYNALIAEIAEENEGLVTLYADDECN